MKNKKEKESFSSQLSRGGLNAHQNRVAPPFFLGELNLLKLFIDK